MFVLSLNIYLSIRQKNTMKHVLALTLSLIAFSCTLEPSQKREIPPDSGPITLVIHGGAGTLTRGTLSAEKEKVYHAKLMEALDSGYAVLERGGKSLEAVITAIKILEDSPLFNAGVGAVFTHDGRNELDASIMDGSNLMAGAVAGVTTIRNPITAAYAVMTKSDHVMLVGSGAEEFAEEQGLDIVPPSYFFDSTRYHQLHKVKGDMTVNGMADDKKFGTVGCVALDQYGNLAAGTSTGGMTNKKYGRVGDSPIIGAGTYANNLTCAVSATGWGEYFIRLNVAHDIHALMEYAGLSVQEAADSVIMKKLPRLGGNGGVIALDREGNFSMIFCTSGMYRGYITKKGGGQTFIYKD
jgi:beta-aspartyl-peptidase (threonine type)